MARIREKDLENLVAKINKLLKTDIYELDFAYGGVKLTRKDTYNDVLNSGYRSKTNLYDLILAFYCGICEG